MTPSEVTRCAASSTNTTTPPVDYVDRKHSPSASQA